MTHLNNSSFDNRALKLDEFLHFSEWLNCVNFTGILVSIHKDDCCLYVVQDLFHSGLRQMLIQPHNLSATG